MKQLSYNQEQDICECIAKNICEANKFDDEYIDSISEAVEQFGIMETIREFLERYEENYLPTKQ